MTAPTAASPARILMKGNQAMAEAAIQAGCDAYFGYPITPQAELLEWMARRMPELGRAFVQAESELGAINMALGAAATGARVMVSTSSPGMSLMAEAMSYMAGSETPLVLVNVMRGGPGLGSIGPSQSDYFQAVKGHGHGDYRVPVLAPASIGEAVELVARAFELAERYRRPDQRVLHTLQTNGTLLDEARARASEFIDRGRLQLVFYDFPLGGSHVHSFLAARAARLPAGFDRPRQGEMQWSAPTNCWFAPATPKPSPS